MKGFVSKKHGYPPGHVPRRNANNQVQAHNAMKSGDESVNEQSQSSSNFTQEQVNHLLQVIP